jgi:translation initiation factor 3 subunit K
MAELSVEDWRKSVEPHLSGIDRYNPENVGKLERYLEFQVESGSYHFEANLTLIKLYQFNAGQFNVRMVAMALLKALMQLPENEFTFLKYLIPVNKYEDDTLKPVFDMHRLLENCSFKEFWAYAKENSEVFAHVKGFEVAIRNYICGLLTLSYQNISSTQLLEVLGFVLEGELEELAKEKGWTSSSHQFFLCNQEEHVKPKKIISRIEFDSVSAILSAADS